MHKLGTQMSPNHRKAIRLHKGNDNPRWGDAEKLEVERLNGYDPSKDSRKDAPALEGHPEITRHSMHKCKYGGRLNLKARFVAGGHHTKTSGQTITRHDRQRRTPEPVGSGSRTIRIR